MTNQIIELLGTKFSNINANSFFYILSKSVAEGIKTTIVFPNAYICSYAHEHKNYNSILNEFDLIVPDGIGVYIASRFLYSGHGFKEKTVSTDIWYKLFASDFGYKFFLIGGAKDCNIKIQKKFANIVDSLPELSEEIEDLNKINFSNANILMVALGTPFQEGWIIKNKDKINVPVIIAVGSGLDFLAGAKKRAPVIMRNIGLEWLHRLSQEPKRLWKRYLIGIPVFIFYVIQFKFKLMLKK